MRDKVDHPRKGSKDLADAVCGSVFNAISRTRADLNQEVNVHTYESFVEDRDLKEPSDGEVYVQNMIRAPRMPQHLSDAIENMELI